jgi:spore coat polysaccharide biosynthesis protein SpsF
VAEHCPDVTVARGPEDDVLRRTLVAAETTGATTLVRVTSDCPYLDPDVSGAVLAAADAAGVPYARTAFRSGYPLGFDTEVVRTDALRVADAEATDPYEREHATPFIWRHPERFPCIWLDHLPDLRSWRLVVDAQEDYELAETVYDELGPGFRLAQLETLFADRPELLAINRDVAQTRYVGIPGEAP